VRHYRRAEKLRQFGALMRTAKSNATHFGKSEASRFAPGWAIRLLYVIAADEIT